MVLVPAVLLWWTIGAAGAGPLRYAPKAGQTITYKVEVTATLPTEIETCQGTIHYRILSADDPLKLQFEGGLMQTSKPTTSADASPRGSYGPRGPRFAPRPSFSPGFHGPRGPMFGMNDAFRGIGHASNTITLSPRGEIRTMDGDSQLPYLLGNLSLLIFEPLGETDQKSWTVDTGVTVTEKNDDSWGWHRPRFFPGGGDKMAAGTESNAFSWETDQGDLSTFRKTYRLDSPGDGEKLSANGSGKWTFNRALGMPESLDYSGTLVVELKGITVTVPVTVKYHRLTDAERAEMAKKAEKLAAERKTPIEGEDREKLLADLKSGDTHRQMQALTKINMKDVRKDEELAAAIRPLLDSQFHKRTAERALAKVSPDFQKKHDVQQQYDSIVPVKVTGEPVTADTPLPAGLIVAFKQHNQWYAGKVVGTIGEDRVVVQRPRIQRTEVCARSDLRLAPPGVAQPDAEASSAGTSSAGAATASNVNSLRGNRVWTDASGTFTIMAKFAGVDGGAVRLVRKADGKEIKVPLARLCKEDHRVVEQLQRSPAPGNPFE
jgi:hypothetical protein